QALDAVGRPVADEHHVLTLQQVHVLALGGQGGVDLTDRVVQPADHDRGVVRDPDPTVVQVDVRRGHTLVVEAERDDGTEHQGHDRRAGDATLVPAQPSSNPHHAPVWSTCDPPG